MTVSAAFFPYNAFMEMTVEKILQSQGFGTRRQCRDLVLNGDVEIDGKVCEDPSERFLTDGLVFTVDGKTWLYRKHLYLMMHKPEGYECSHEPQYHASVFALVPWQFLNRNLQCVGRLDQDTTGLLLLSDDGQFIHRYTSPKKHVPKVYRLALAEPISETQVSALMSGVQLRQEKQVSKALSCQPLGTDGLEMAIDEGKYHQVKRMMAAVGNRVVALHRHAIGGLTLPGDLDVGQWRYLTEDDLQKLAELRIQQG